MVLSVHFRDPPLPLNWFEIFFWTTLLVRLPSLWQLSVLGVFLRWKLSCKVTLFNFLLRPKPSFLPEIFCFPHYWGHCSTLVGCGQSCQGLPGSHSLYLQDRGSLFCLCTLIDDILLPTPLLLGVSSFPYQCPFKQGYWCLFGFLSLSICFPYLQGRHKVICWLFLQVYSFFIAVMVIYHDGHFEGPYGVSFSLNTRYSLAYVFLSKNSIFCTSLSTNNWPCTMFWFLV